MANHASAKKRIRQTAKRTVRNRYAKATMRTSIKKFLAAFTDGDTPKTQLTELFRYAASTINKTASKGAIPKKRANRLISRLSKRLAPSHPTP